MFSVLSYRREGTVAKVTAGSSVLKCSGACVYLSSHVTAAEVKNRQQTLEQTGKKQTYILIGGLVEGDQVGVKASQSHHRPEREKTHQNLQHSATGVKETTCSKISTICCEKEKNVFVQQYKRFLKRKYALCACSTVIQLVHKHYVQLDI